MSFASLRDLLEDERMAAVKARVEKHEGESEYWAVNDDGHLEIQVVTLNHGVPIVAHMTGGGAGSGFWWVPPVGAEVMVTFDNGDFEGDATITGVFGAAPNGLAPGTMLVLGSDVQVRTLGGTAKALTTVDHFHLDSTGSPTGGPITTAIPNVPNPNFPVPDSVHPFLDENGIPTTHPFHDGDADGTTVLKAQ